jgi:hypothetical protein
VISKATVRSPSTRYRSQFPTWNGVIVLLLLGAEIGRPGDDQTARGSAVGGQD